MAINEIDGKRGGFQLEKWKLSVWGVRGAAPAPGADFLEFGGHTSCISLDCGNALTVFDAGSGLTALGDALARSGGPKRVDLLLSHLHLDHVLGLFSFRPFFDPAAEVHLYGRPGLADGLNRLVGPPFWPVALAGFPAKLHIHETACGVPFSLPGGLTVQAMESRHPNGCFCYRVERGEKRLVYTLDCEPDEPLLDALADFARGADLLIWDANFAPEAFKEGWGHSTWLQGLEALRRAQAKAVLMTHYNRDYTDAFLHVQERLAAQANCAAYFAKEGMVIEL